MAIFKNQRTLMKLCDFTGKIEPKPGAFLACIRSRQGKKALEYAIANKIRDTRALIKDIDSSAIILGMNINRDIAPGR